MGKKKTYEAAPQVPPDRAAIYEAIVQVQAHTLTVSEAARRLGLSRNHFQTLMHRGLAALIEGIATKPPGRPARPEREAELEAKVDQLERENARLRGKAEMIDRMLNMAGGVLRGEIPIGRRTKKDRPMTTPGNGSRPRGTSGSPA